LRLNQYQLTFFTAHHPTTEPFVRVTSSLAEAVSIAWRNSYHGGRNVSIICNEELEVAGIVEAEFSRPHNGHEAEPDQCASK
jgi:hypothetical protein